MNLRSFTDSSRNLSDSPLPARTMDGHAAKRGVTGVFYGSASDVHCTIMYMYAYTSTCLFLQTGTDNSIVLF